MSEHLGFFNEHEQAEQLTQPIRAAMEALGIPGEMAGHGATILPSKDFRNVSVGLDVISSRLVYRTPEKFTAAEFAMEWGCAMVTYGIADGAKEAINRLIYRTPDDEEALSIFHARWLSAEAGMNSVMQSLIAEHPEKEPVIKEGFSHVMGREGCAIPAMSSDCGDAILRLKQVLASAGIHIEKDLVEMLGNLSGIRASAIAASENSGDTVFYVPCKYFDRMQVLAGAVSDFSIMERAPGMALGVFVASKTGEASPVQGFLAPTQDELVEIERQIDGFSRTLGGDRPRMRPRG